MFMLQCAKKLRSWPKNPQANVLLPPSAVNFLERRQMDCLDPAVIASFLPRQDVSIFRKNLAFKLGKITNRDHLSARCDTPETHRVIVAASHQRAAVVRKAQIMDSAQMTF